MINHKTHSVHDLRIAAYKKIRSERLEPYKQEIDAYFKRQQYKS